MDGFDMLGLSVPHGFGIDKQQTRFVQRERERVCSYQCAQNQAMWYVVASNIE